MKTRELSLFLCLLIAPLASVNVKAHKNYTFPCCGNNDCGIIKSIVYRHNGDRVITIINKDGALKSALFPKGYIEQPSSDAESHACISDEGMPRCLFIAGVV